MRTAHIHCVTSLTLLQQAVMRLAIERPNHVELIANRIACLCRGSGVSPHHRIREKGTPAQASPFHNQSARRPRKTDLVERGQKCHGASGFAISSPLASSIEGLDSGLP